MDNISLSSNGMGGGVFSYSSISSEHVGDVVEIVNPILGVELDFFFINDELEEFFFLDALAAI
ncbi:hypothetical protein VAEKB19_6710003 [Vibrio aestuarianus]|nr:hypothetical protein VAEKB19_6710003 [Vibrio aestuarianus]